ncbi:extracellular protein [Ruminococcus flavefaciens]|uniref:Extracellular protein n=1 Tax=Ruminococcus flavefaciens TaxID=1265 RepID=A0A1H6KU72_RUMFL|nr:endo alpha-1,4 polygalactosaminidase [Ruminococcus flavefaciens]SEH75170.1 extracellular protein [Ruminococcus flavefaciens]
MKNNIITGIVMAIAMCSAALTSNFSILKAEAADIKYEYGVFLGADPEDVSDMESYKKIVIDAQYFDKEEITRLKDSGHTVYSYINLGSVEEFRSYFKNYEDYFLGVYENWEDERWVDVSQKEWQKFIVDDLAKKILDKGVDGLFVDNCDVYYNFKKTEIFNGVTEILKGFKKYGTYVIINGGDTYVTEYAKKNKSLDAVMDAVNQESVFSAIDWDHDTFTKNSDEDREYFQDYCKLVADYGKDVYLLEYTKDSKVIDSIKKYCKEKGYTYYASSTLDLKTPGQEAGSQPLIKNEETPKKQTLAGDANMDGTVDLSDAVLIMQSLANPDKYGLNGIDENHITEQGTANADVEGGDGMTVNDALAIQKYLLELIPSLPVK